MFGDLRYLSDKHLVHFLNKPSVNRPLKYIFIDYMLHVHWVSLGVSFKKKLRA